MTKIKHLPRFHGTGEHSHQGSGKTYPDDDCPYCRSEYVEENAQDLLGAAVEILEWYDRDGSVGGLVDPIERLREVVRSSQGQQGEKSASPSSMADDRPVPTPGRDE